MLEDLEALFKHIARHKMWYGSVFLHLLILGPLYYLGPIKTEQFQQQVALKQAQGHAEQAKHSRLQERIEDITQLEELMRQVLRTEVDDSANAPSQQNTNSDQSLYQQAKEKADQVRALKNHMDAEVLADLLEIPLTEALLEIEKKISDHHLNEEDLTEQQIEQAINNFHQEIQNTLAEVIEEQQTKTQGISVDLAESKTEREQESTEENTADNSNNDIENNNQTASNNGEGNGGDSDSNSNSNSANHGEGNAGDGGATGQGGMDSSGYATEYISREELEQVKQKLTNSNRKFASSFTGTGKKGSQSNYNNRLLLTAVRPSDLTSKAHFQADGRIVGAGGEKSDQIYMDTWYMIGPFPGGEWDTRDKPFPPEKQINLDAFYPGKNGTVAWQFFQTNEYPLQPPNPEEYGIYYGYTEMVFTEETTAWVGLGCDDFCKLWLNDEMVWRSADQVTKPWYVYGGVESLHKKMAYRDVSEAYTKLTFKKGRNRLLFRLDNGWKQLFFSMTINRLK